MVEFSVSLFKRIAIHYFLSVIEHELGETSGSSKRSMNSKTVTPYHLETTYLQIEIWFIRFLPNANSTSNG